VVISEKNENIGKLSLEKALQYARERNLDLIEVSANSNPPVCRVMELGKYLYRLKKKERTQRKGAKIGKLKNIRISLRISQHDLETKAEKTKKFLSKGYKVRIEVFLRGREKAFSNLAKAKLEKMFENINADIPLKKEGEMKKNPRGMEIIISKK
jgi:translation initiation factor IF-3